MITIRMIKLCGGSIFKPLENACKSWLTNCINQLIPITQELFESSADGLEVKVMVFFVFLKHLRKYTIGTIDYGVMVYVKI